MSTEAELEAMSGTIGSRPDDWTSTSGPSRLGVTVGDTFFASSMTPRTGATCFGYATGGSADASIDQFRRDFTAPELSEISAGGAFLTFSTYGAKDSTVDSDTGRIGIEFFDSGDSSLGAVSWTPALDFQDEFGTNTWGLVALQEAIPTSAAYAILYIEADPVGSGTTPNVFWDDMTAPVSDGTRELTVVNPSWESGATGWSDYGASNGSVNVGASAHSGSFIWYAGSISGAGENGVFQDIALLSTDWGNDLLFEIWGYADGAANAGIYNSLVRLEFYDAGDVLLQTSETSYDVGALFGGSTWGLISHQANIPVDSDYVRIVQATTRNSGSGFSNVWYDDVAVETVAPAPPEASEPRSTQVVRRVLATQTANVRATQVVRRSLAFQGAVTQATQVFRRTLVQGLPCVTQRCMMWSIERRDGRSFYFTSHDRDIVWRDQTFKSCDSLMNTAAEASAVIGDIGDVALKGIISDDSISEEDLFGGLFDDAFVEVWLFDWGSLRLTPKRVAAGWIGDVSHGEDGVDISVLTMGARLDQQSITTPIAPACRFVFGSTECGVDIEALKLTGTVTDVTNRIVFAASLSAGDGGLQWKNGSLLFTYGNNDEQLIEVKDVDFGAGVITLWSPAPLQIQVGDTFDLRPGCDKAFDGGCDLYNNRINFGGFPDVPGNDEMTKTPNAKA